MPSRRASDGSRVKSAPCARLWPASTMEDGSVMREPFMVGRTAKRIRRTPEAAKLAILEAAERRLIEDGPDRVARAEAVRNARSAAQADGIVAIADTDIVVCAAAEGQIVGAIADL